MAGKRVTGSSRGGGSRASRARSGRRQEGGGGDRSNGARPLRGKRGRRRRARRLALRYGYQPEGWPLHWTAFFCARHGVICGLQGAAGGGAGGPGPLEVEAAQVAGDVDNFADEEEAGDFARFHGFAGEFVGVDAAGGDFGFFVAFGAGGA